MLFVKASDCSSEVFFKEAVILPSSMSFHAVPVFMIAPRSESKLPHQFSLINRGVYFYFIDDISLKGT